MKRERRKIFLILAETALLSLLLITFLQCTRSEKRIQVDQLKITEFVPFDQFLEEINKARFEDYRNKAGFIAANEDEFSKMKQHILSLYNGVKVKNSFVMDDAMFIDCIDINTQPGLKQDGKQLTIEKPPAFLDLRKEGADEQQGTPVPPMLSREKMDKFGNVMYCDSGYIPMKRITLDEVTRFETLNDFFNKYGKAGQTGLPEEQ